MSGQTAAAHRQAAYTAHIMEPAGVTAAESLTQSFYLNSSSLLHSPSLYARLAAQPILTLSWGGGGGQRSEKLNNTPPFLGCSCAVERGEGERGGMLQQWRHGGWGRGLFWEVDMTTHSLPLCMKMCLFIYFISLPLDFLTKIFFQRQENPCWSMALAKDFNNLNIFLRNYIFALEHEVWWGSLPVPFATSSAKDNIFIRNLFLFFPK